MTDPRPEYVMKAERRGWYGLLAFLTIALFAWFVVVLVGETADWTDDPGRWALIPTFVWAFLALAAAGLLIVYSLALLVVREESEHVYQQEGPIGAETGVEPSTPSFLQNEPRGLE